MDAIYARQSVDKADSLSIQGQIDLCRREMSPEYQVYEDKGYSGKNTDRPAFQRLMADVEQGLLPLHRRLRPAVGDPEAAQRRIHIHQ